MSRPLNYYNELAIRRGTHPPPKSKPKPFGPPRSEEVPAPHFSYFRKLGPNRRPEGYTTRARRPSSNEPNPQPSAKRQRNTINDVDYNDNDDYVSQIRFPRRVSPVRRSTSLMSQISDQSNYVDVPEAVHTHPFDSSPLLPNELSQNTSSNLSISSNIASNFGDSTDIHDNVQYSMESEPSATQLQQHDNHEAQESFHGDQTPEASPSSSLETAQSFSSTEPDLHRKIPQFLLDWDDKYKDIMLQAEFNDDDYDESTLSDVSAKDVSSGYSSAEGDDEEYDNLKDYRYRLLGNPIAIEVEKCIHFTHELTIKFWDEVIALKETRKSIINELNRRLKKPRKFRDDDVVVFNQKIDSIKLYLNLFIPTISKLRATYIRGSNKNLVLFQGHKYSKSRQSPSRYKCSYNADSDAKNFDYSLDNCLGYLELDGKGYLQPGSFIRHFHGPVKNCDFDQHLAEQVPAKFDKVAAECNNDRKQKKLNHFLTAKVQQAIKFSDEALDTKSYEQLIQKQLEELTLLNNLYEEEENYIPSFIEWIDFFRIHVRIGDVQKFDKCLLRHRSDLIAESIHSTLKSNDDFRYSGLDTLDIIENDKRFELYNNKWWVCKGKIDRSKANLKDIMENICVKFMETNTQVTKSVGRGGFGNVRRIYFNGNDTEFVEKVFKNIHSPDSLIAEAAAFTECDKTEYIPKMIYCGYNAEGQWCTVMEYIKGGTLQYHVKNSTIPEKGKQTIAYQLALALEHLHKNRLTHGDLKPNNVALTLTGHVRLFDFGQSRSILVEKNLPFSVPFYSAPEVMLHEPAGLAADRWSYGVLFAYLIKGTHPFINMKWKEVKRNKTYGVPNLEGINDDIAKELINGLLQHNQNDRIKNISTHRYFNGVEEKDPPFKPMNIQMADTSETNGTSFSRKNRIMKKLRNIGNKFVKREKCAKRECHSNEFVELHPFLQKWGLKIPSKAYLNTFKKLPGASGDAV